MSYDIRFYVKTVVPNLEGDRYVSVHAPKYDSPTYNYRKMFVALMDWDYSQGEYYHMPEVLERLKTGLGRIKADPEAYRKYEPDNKWGTVEGARECLESWVDELTPPDDGCYGYDNVMCQWPLDALWWRW